MEIDMQNIAFVGAAILVIIGLALLFHILAKVTPEEGWASSLMLILMFVYIAGLMGNTGYALVLVYVLSVVGLLLSVAAWACGKDYSLKTFFTPGIVMILGAAGIGLVTFRGMHICNWDELYQWGKAANFMVEFDKLPGGESFSGETVLLSSTTFFHYFIAKISYLVTGSITESNYYVSNLLLWFSALALPFSGEGWKSWKRIWAFGIFHFWLAALIFVQPYYNIYTDQATAYWAGGLIAWLLLGRNTKRNLYLIPLVLLNVGLMKSMVGPLFAVIVVMVIVILYLVSRRERKERIIPADWKKYLFSKRGLLCICAVLSPVVLILIWSAVTGQNGLFRFNGLAVQPGQENRGLLTLKSMIGWIFKSVNLQQESFYLSYGLFFLLTVGMVCVVYPMILDRKDRLRYNSVMRIYILGFAGYFLVMFFAFMTVFGYDQSIQTTSLNRYYSDYMMLGVVPLTVPLFHLSGTEKNSAVKCLKKGIIFISFLYIVHGSNNYFLQNLVRTYALDTKNYAEREKMIGYTQKIKDITGESGKIYFINQKKSGLFTLVADYELGNQLMRGGMCFRFRKDTSKSISGLTDYPIETLPNVLAEQGYEYIWVYSTNEYFNDNMEELFGIKEVKNGKFYKVISTEDGVELEYMKRIK
ncbi:MAG: hypothetical protein NC124_15550 [Clostridium sp.]|nr:hypothetical protein [Clostridium sp.]